MPTQGFDFDKTGEEGHVKLQTLAGVCYGGAALTAFAITMSHICAVVQRRRYGRI